MPIFRTFTVFTLLVVNLHGFNAQASSLLEVYQWAKVNDLSFQAAQSRFMADMEQGKIARSNYLPQLNYRFRIMQNDFESEETTINGFSEFDFIVDCQSAPDEIACLEENLLSLLEEESREYQSTESSLSLSQPIYDARRLGEYSKGKLIQGLARLELKEAGMELVIRVLDAYLDVLRAEDRLTFALQQLQSIQTQQALAEKRYRLGVGKETEVYDAQAAYDLQVSNYELAMVNQQMALRKLSDITGVEMSQVYPLSDAMPVEMPYPPEPAEWFRKALANNPSLAKSRIHEKIAHIDMKQSRNSRLPSVNLAASYISRDYSGDEGISPATDISSIGLELHLPLYQGGRLGANRKRAAHEYDRARRLQGSVEKQLESDIANTLLLIKTGVNRYFSRQRAVESSRKALDATNRAYEDGVSTLLELFAAQKNYYQARLNLSLSRYDYIRDLYTLKSLAGELNEDTLRAIDGWFKPSGQ